MEDLNALDNGCSKPGRNSVRGGAEDRLAVRAIGSLAGAADGTLASALV